MIATLAIRENSWKNTGWKVLSMNKSILEEMLSNTKEKKTLGAVQVV
jgi:hypothetical protein